MIHRAPLRLAAAILLAATLDGCGSDPEPDPAHLAADVPWPVDAAEARRLTGAGDPTFTEADAYAAQQKIVAAADSFLMTDVFSVNEKTGEVVYIPVTCEMASCTAAAGPVTLVTELSDLPFAQADYKTRYRSEPIGELHGFWFEQTVGKDTGRLSGLDMDVKAGGGWLDHSGFAVFGYTNAEQGLWAPGAISLGQSSGGPPEGMGTATFLGTMVATDANLTSPLVGSVIAGTATITVALGADPTVDVGFTDMHNLNAGTPRDDLTWSGLDLQDGRFGDDTIDGRFYGPQGKEVGGVFQRDQMIGGFGAKRE